MVFAHMNIKTLSVIALFFGVSLAFSQSFVLPVATEEVINAPVKADYPKPSSEQPDTSGLSSRRPTPTMTSDELQMKPVSTHAARYSFIGTWKTKSRTLSFVQNNVFESENDITLTFSPEGYFVQESYDAKYKINTRFEGQWRVVDGLLEMYNAKNKTRTAFSSIRNTKMNDMQVLIRWYGENSFEMLPTDLDRMAYTTQKNTPNVSSVAFWYDERGNFIIKTVMKVNIQDFVKETTSFIIKGRELYKKQ